MIFYPGTGVAKEFYRGSFGACAPVISADGTQVAFLTPTATMDKLQVFMANIDGTSLRAVTSDVEGVSEFTLTAEGQTVWFKTPTKAIYRLDVATAEAQQKIPATCKAKLNTLLSPRSAAFFSATCPNQEYTSSFGALSTIEQARATAPLFASTAIHQDWSGSVTANSPASPNETIHFLATGPGAVQNLKLVTELECNLPTIFAGLAPGIWHGWLLSNRPANAPSRPDRNGLVPWTS